MPGQPRPCQHSTLHLEPSACAARVGFKAIPPAEILAAASASSSPNTSRSASAAAAAAEEEEGLKAFFPAPLVLPGDELAYEPGEQGQSFAEWLDEEERNKPTSRRGVLYVAAAPRAAREVGHIEAWTRSRVTAGQAKKNNKNKKRAVTAKGGVSHMLQPPRTEDIIEFLAAFYHGVQVKPLPESLQFVPWDGEQDDDEVAAGKVSYIGLAAGDSCTRIRVRSGPPPSPSASSSSNDSDGVFEAQLNLEDILDAAISMLPPDAYSILILVDHDLYETDDDDFCCGRAYGGSRVCVVQSARYNPALDAAAGIDRAHMWPASHCGAYMDGLCRAEGISVKKSAAAARSSSKTTTTPSARGGPANSSALQLAVDAAVAVQQPGTTADHGNNNNNNDDDDDNHDNSDDAEHELQVLQGLWLSRLARTAAHEVGHCFGMDHCVYAACLMQGTASMAEDVRQPPYLCAVCVAKVGHAVAGELMGATARKKKKTKKMKTKTEEGEEHKERAREQTAYLVERYRAIADFCDKWSSHVGMFAGYRAWANARIEKMLERTT
ncbi:archaemetzincin [Microdochium nivale]|nr:archaemetzincin [Microdochium nivale]